jgi:hypothetical protein
MSDAKLIADLVGRFRRILDKLDRAVEQPVPFWELSECRELCRKGMMVADRLQRSEDDGK